MGNWLPIVVNFILLFVALVAAILLLTKVKFNNNNYKLLFFLYLVYLIAPSMLKQYTGKIHNDLIRAKYDHPDLLNLVWVPTFVYGIIGIFWNPLADFLVTKFKSRKSIILLSLIVQFVGVVPMIIKPCFVTNIIQSLCIGISIGAVSIFILMFNEQYGQKKIFTTVSLLSLPPMVAGFTAATLISIVTSFINEKLDTPQERVGKLKWILIIGLIFIIFAMILSIFLKENKELVFADNKYKEAVTNNSEICLLFFVLLISLFSTFIKHCTSGGSMLLEMKFIAKHSGKGEIIDKFSAYLTPLQNIGNTSASLLTGFVLVKKYKKATLFVFASMLWLLFAIFSGIFVNIETKFILAIVNGFCYGMITNLLSGVMMKKYFAKTTKITPITLLSVLSSFGVVIGSFLNTFIKKPLLTKDYTTVPDVDWDEFMKLNRIIMLVIIFSIIFICFLFLSQDFIAKKYQKKVQKEIN